MLLDDHILSFLFNLSLDVPLPAGIQVLNPFSDSETRRVCQQFYSTYYHDDKPRRCLIGINPGRFGAGITGIPFTDPIRLEKVLNIANPWPKKQELSSIFIYELIEAMGGPVAFYSRLYITAISPLGFTHNGKNINYYDQKLLQQVVEPFVLHCLQKQLSWGLDRQVAYCIGEGKNFKYLVGLNQKYSFFGEVIPLPHPRFVMQYKLRQKNAYIEHYIQAITH